MRAYDDAKCYVLHQAKISEECEVQIGGRQSYILSLIIFLLIIDDFLHPALAGGHVRFNGRCHLSPRICTTVMTFAFSLTAPWSWPNCSGLKVKTNKIKVLSVRSNVTLLICMIGQNVEKLDSLHV